MARATRGQGIGWAAAGVLLLALFLAAGWRLFRRNDPGDALARKAERLELVAQLETALARNSEAEKSAVLAVTDDESRSFADQARAASADLEKTRRALEARLAGDATDREREALGRFTASLASLRKVDEEVLTLAVRNSNLKAYAMAFGPAKAALAELGAALDRAVARAAGSPDAARALQQACGARVALLEVQTLLAPHIAEESDRRMDEMEAIMNREMKAALQDLDGLEGIPSLRGSADVAAARGAVGRFLEAERQIVELSRENTNVRSLSLSLTEKRKAMLACAEVLADLARAVREEPVPGGATGRPALPR